MRLLLDTNIFVYFVQDREMLSRDARAMIQDYDNLLYMSAESLRELIVAYRNKGLLRKLISHAMTENLTLISSDTRFPFYEKQGLQLISNQK